jgi:hypothetical protein
MLITYFALRPLKSTLKFVPEGVVESIERSGVSDMSNDNGQASSPLHGEGNGLTAPLLAGDDEQVSSMVDVPGGDTHKLMWMGQQKGLQHETDFAFLEVLLVDQLLDVFHRRVHSIEGLPRNVPQPQLRGAQQRFNQ